MKLKQMDHEAQLEAKQRDHEAQLASHDGNSRQLKRWVQKADARVHQLMGQLKVLEAEKAQAVRRADTAEKALETRLDLIRAKTELELALSKK